MAALKDKHTLHNFKALIHNQGSERVNFFSQLPMSNINLATLDDWFLFFKKTFTFHASLRELETMYAMGRCPLLLPQKRAHFFFCHKVINANAPTILLEAGEKAGTSTGHLWVNQAFHDLIVRGSCREVGSTDQ